jgi:hypothetical protein
MNVADCIPSGIYFLAMEFGRGTNLKFKVDAVVHVICNGKGAADGLTTVDWEKAQQCSGRASRRMGLNLSYCYLVSPHADKVADHGVTFLKSRRP